MKKRILLALMLLCAVLWSVAGILFKLTAPGPTDPTVWLYVLNLVIVGTDLALYFRYRHNVPPAA